MVKIVEEKCIGCGLCVQDCPVKNLAVVNEKATVRGTCMECGHCFAVCPSKAVCISDYPSDGIIEFKNEVSYVSGDEFLRFIKSRRSIRNYQEKRIDKETWAKVLEAGRFTATGANIQDVKYMVVQDELETVKKYVWSGFTAMIEQLKRVQGEGNPLVQRLQAMNAVYQASPQNDPLFFNAPSLLVITSGSPLNGGLAASNIELMAHAEGLGVLFSGFIQRGLAANDAACDYLGIEKTHICACMLVGYPNIKYQRSVPRKTAEIQWR